MTWREQFEQSQPADHRVATGPPIEPCVLVETGDVSSSDGESGVSPPSAWRRSLEYSQPILAVVLTPSLVCRRLLLRARRLRLQRLPPDQNDGASPTLWFCRSVYSRQKQRYILSATGV